MVLASLDHVWSGLVQRGDGRKRYPKRDLEAVLENRCLGYQQLGAAAEAATES